MGTVTVTPANGYSRRGMSGYRAVGVAAAPAFSPSTLSSIVDYGVRNDLTRLRTASDGSGPEPVVDDLIGWWRGQLDVLTFAQTSTIYKMTLTSNGVRCSSGYNHLLANYSYAYDAPTSLGYHAMGTAGSRKSSLGHNAVDAYFITTGIHDGNPSDPFKASCAGGTLTTFGTMPADCTVVFTRAVGANADVYLNAAAPVVIPAGGSVATLPQIALGSYVDNSGAALTLDRWIVCNQKLTGSDLTNVQNWLAGV